MKKLRILILQFLIFSLFSCSFVSDIDEREELDASKTLVMTGTLASSGSAQANAASRQAFASAASGTLYYTLSCTNGTVTYDGTVDSSTLTYTVQVPLGSSTVTAKAFLDSAKTQQVYKGTLSLSDVTSSSDLSNKTITLSDIQSGTDATATVSLPITISSDVAISSIKAVVSTSSTTTNVELSSVTSGTTYYFTLSDFATTAATTANAVPGVYDVVFDFYALDSSSNEYLIFQTNQKISASNYLTTSSWKGIGADSCINSSGTLEITKTLCDSFLSTSFYIDASNGSDTSASGSFSSPFKSIQKAVNVIKSRGTTDACTIYLKSGITATSTDEFTNGSLVEIADSANLNLKIKSYPSTSTFTIDAASLGRIFYVGSGNSLTIQNLTLQNGKATDASAADTTNGAIISGNGFTSLELNKVSITSDIGIDSGKNIVAGSNGYGISVNKTITLSGSCTFDATFYLSDSATISFSSTYANASSTNSCYVNVPESNYVEGTKILEGENISTNAEPFAPMKNGWNLDSSTGCLKQNIKHTSYTADGTNVIELTSSVTSFESGKTYLISDKTALSTLATLVNGGKSGGGSNFVLTANIDLESSCPDIGSLATYSFNGTFDGNNYCIYNLSASSGGDSLFKYLGDKNETYSASVKNLRVKGTSTASLYSGGIAANTYGSVTISNCISDVKFSPSDNGRYLGGIVGYINAGSVEIKNCVNNGNITTTYASDTAAAYVAGFVGDISGSATLNISNCVNNGNVSSSAASNYLAGFSNVEQSSATVTITYCVNNGTITSSGTQVGAFTGDSYSTISSSMYYIPSGSSITAKHGDADSSATNLTDVSSFSSLSSSLATTMNSYIESDSSYVSWTTNTSGYPDLNLQIEDSN